MPEPASALWSTPSGRVDSPGTTTIFEQNRARVATLAGTYPETDRRWRAQPGASRRDILEALAIEAPPTPRVEVIGSERRGDHTLTHLAYWTESDLYLPASHFAPEGTSAGGAAVLLVGSGERTEEVPTCSLTGWWPAAFMSSPPSRAGPARRAGTGSSRFASDDDPLLGAEANLTHDAWLLGTNVVGWRARDLLAGLACLRGRPGVNPSLTFVVGLEPAGATPALFAATLDGRVARTALVGPLVSYRSMADTRLGEMPSSLIPWGVLRRFDLPQVMAVAAQRPLLLANVVTASGEPATPAELASLRRDTGVGGGLEIVQGVQDPFKLVTDWLAQAGTAAER